MRKLGSPQSKRHYKTHRKLYHVWSAMVKRCINPNCTSYSRYGAKGIKVCDEWKTPDDFCVWALANGYQEGLEIDRIDYCGNYEPSNCRFVDNITQARNKSNNTLLVVNNQVKCIAKWVDITNIHPATISNWVQKYGKEYAQERIKKL